MSRFEVATAELESAAGVLRGVAGEAVSGRSACGTMGEGAMEAALGSLFARAGDVCAELSDAAAGNARSLGGRHGVLHRGRHSRSDAKRLEIAERRVRG